MSTCKVGSGALNTASGQSGLIPCLLYRSMPTPNPKAFVQPAYRGRTTARAHMNHTNCIAWGQAEGQLMLGIESTNQEAERQYEHVKGGELRASF